MSWFQKTLTLPSKSRGSYLITSDVVNQLPELQNYKVGILNLFIQHTSCALSLNENWDSDVRADMSDALDRIVPEDKGEREGLYRHDAEGSDDMPVSYEKLSSDKNEFRCSWKITIREHFQKIA
jgi:secondary thiamine-phosphate synthase enzyme